MYSRGRTLNFDEGDEANEPYQLGAGSAAPAPESDGNYSDPLGPQVGWKIMINTILTCVSTKLLAESIKIWGHTFTSFLSHYNTKNKNDMYADIEPDTKKD